MGSIASIRAAIAPVVSRAGSQLDGMELKSVVDKLAELPRKDFDRLSRALLKDTFTAGKAVDDAFNFVINLKAHGKVEDLLGAMGTILHTPPPSGRLGDFDPAGFKTAMQGALDALAATGKVPGAKIGEVHEQLAALPKGVFDKLTESVTGQVFWGDSMRNSTFEFLMAAESQQKLPELAKAVEQLTA